MRFEIETLATGLGHPEGPNACILGSDGAVYITQNGGTVGAWKADVMSTPSIQKASTDGRGETVVEEVDGVPLQAPHDLTFGPDGRPTVEGPSRRQRYALFRGKVG